MPATTGPARSTLPVTRRPGLTLREAFEEFTRWPTARILAAAVVGAVTARIVVGGFTVGDAIVPAVMLAAYPLAEWCIHVLLLHMKPKRLGAWSLDPLVARKHREHHADPTDTELVFIPVPVLWGQLVGAVAIATLVFPRLELGLTFLVTLTIIGAVYEWTHYLVHTTYRPKGRLYRALWRHHRLHHYKNEHYWFGVVTTAADHALRTAPDPSTVDRSPTARDLHGATAGAETDPS